jgi:hypothetical protein
MTRGATMMTLEWSDGRYGDSSVCSLGRGLYLSVERTMVRLPEGEPPYIVTVLGRHLKLRSATKEEGKKRAERAAKQWLNEVLAKFD